MRITKFALAMAIGATATTAWAQSPTGYGTGPALPLPEISSSWNTGAAPTGVVSTSYNSPSGSSWDQNPQGAIVHPNTNQPAPPPATDDSVPSVATAPSYSSEPTCGATQPSSSCGCEGGYGGNGECGCCCNPWYGYAGGLVMTRTQPNRYWTTYNETNNADQVLNTAQAKPGWDGGAEFTIGRCLGCDSRIEATYWGVWNMNGSASISGPNDLGTPMDTTVGNVMIGTQTADSFFTHADEVLLKRNDQVNNVEINWCYNPCGADRSCGVSSSWMAGFRYFRFDEDLLWTSVAANDYYGEAGGADQANLEIRCKNDLTGFQVGNRLDWRFCNRCGLFLGTKGGIYGNDMSTTSSLYSGSGVQGFNYSGHKEGVAFIGQADLGLTYDFNCRWSATLGYRLVVASGLALSDNQIPFYLAGQGDFEEVKSNGDLVLHGGFAGVQFCW
ncbi:MAG TPA: hypothetical protein VHX65_11575 [Pirellulales bacterium]|jgi:hypothetical protein|nr:hypothetical protein [Pirellulales bacterium]